MSMPPPRQGTTRPSDSGGSAAATRSRLSTTCSLTRIGGKSSAESSTLATWSASLDGSGGHHVHHRDPHRVRIQDEADVAVTALHHHANAAPSRSQPLGPYGTRRRDRHGRRARIRTLRPQPELGRASAGENRSSLPSRASSTRAQRSGSPSSRATTNRGPAVGLAPGVNLSTRSSGARLGTEATDTCRYRDGVTLGAAGFRSNTIRSAGSRDQHGLPGASGRGRVDMLALCARPATATIMAPRTGCLASPAR